MKDYQIHFTLRPKNPFRLDYTVWVLKRRKTNILENWNGTEYGRVLIIENRKVKITVKQVKNGLHVTAVTQKKIPKLKTIISSILTKIFGLDVDLKPFYKLGRKETHFYPLILKFKGVKPVCFPTLFEAFVNAITFQQISLEAGFSILNKFVIKYGTPLKCEGEIYYAFPEAKKIKKATKRELMSLGFSGNKSLALMELAHTVIEKDLRLLINDELITYFCTFRGIGRWSAEYVLLRGLGRIEIIPGDDVGVHNRIAEFFDLDYTPTFDDIKKLEKKWYPYAGMLYFHLLLESL